MHFFVSVPVVHSVLGVSTFQLSPGFTRKFVSRIYIYPLLC